MTLDAIIREVESLSLSGFLRGILLLREGGEYVEYCAGPSLHHAFNDAIRGLVLTAQGTLLGAVALYHPERREPLP